MHSSASQYVRVQCASECSAISVQCASVCIRCTVVPLCFCRSPRVRLCKSHRRHPPRLPAGLNHTRQNTLNNQISRHWDAAGPTEKSAHCEDLEKCHLIGRAQSGLAVLAVFVKRPIGIARVPLHTERSGGIHNAFPAIRGAFTMHTGQQCRSSTLDDAPSRRRDQAILAVIQAGHADVLNTLRRCRVVVA